MENYVFDRFLRECQVVHEATSVLEILNYSDPSRNVCRESDLDLSDFDNFLHRRGAFAPIDVSNTEFLGGLRLILQQNACHADTFKPNCISLPTACYEDMFDVFHLPKSSVETTSAVGPLFWSSFDDDEEGHHMRIIHRKADVRKRGHTRGWELILCHSFKTNIVSGYAKGTVSSHLVEAIAQLKACITDVSHPMVLPLIFFSGDLSSQSDQKQRDARAWLIELEKSLYRQQRPELQHLEPNVGLLDIDLINQDIVDCHAQTLWKPSHAYSETLDELLLAMENFWHKWSTFEQKALTNDAKVGRKATARLHKHMVSRLHLYRIKLKGSRTYRETTLERLRVQRDMLNTVMSQREARFNVEIAGEQRRIAYATKKDSVAMKTLSLIGVIFLPGTFIATIFGMSFFNYESEAGPVSDKIWIYFVVTVPTTIVLLLTWAWYEARQREEDVLVEESIDQLERSIMAGLRRRTHAGGTM